MKKEKIKSYSEAIAYLFDALPVFQHVGGTAYKPGLERVEAILDVVGAPHKALSNTIHIAGTNGKGSTSCMLAAILQAAGYKVGLYTSPHLVDFRERIRICGEMIPETYMVDFVNDIVPRIAKEIHPSFFELTTAMAYAYFRDMKVDYAVIETGLGGRLDCTNVISPLVSIITNVSLDHTAYLGDTLEAIAFEKAGIIKPHTPVILGNSSESEVTHVVQERCRALKSSLYMADKVQPEAICTPPSDGVGYVIQDSTFGKLYQPLTGVHQIENTRTVLLACKILKEKCGVQIVARDVAEGLLHTQEAGLRGRMEVLQESAPRILLDTGHNPGAWVYLSQELAQMERNGLAVLMGMAADKDVQSVVDRLPATAHYIFCKASGARSLPAEELQRMAIARGLKASVVESVAEGYETALRLCQEQQLATLFVGGSNFVAGELLGYLQRKETV